MRVLVVDGSLGVRARLAERLREAGLQVVGESGSAAAALELAKAQKPDAVIFDLVLPDQAGLELLRELCRLTPAPLLVVLTNLPKVLYRDRCHAAGADFFLDKSREFELVAPLLLEGRRR